jgi:hypothetical protein|tara:strand:- start:150 stop:407 length:258 start_codon:yes stop_codon:yes gene_type:complete
MPKIHGNKKREYKLAAHKNHEKTLRGVVRAKRVRTFGTEEAANKYAEANKVGTFELKKVKKNKRFQIVPTTKPAKKVEETPIAAE